KKQQDRDERCGTSGERAHGRYLGTVSGTAVRSARHLWKTESASGASGVGAGGWEVVGAGGGEEVRVRRGTGRQEPGGPGAETGLGRTRGPTAGQGLSGMRGCPAAASHVRLSSRCGWGGGPRCGEGAGTGVVCACHRGMDGVEDSSVPEGASVGMEVEGMPA